MTKFFGGARLCLQDQPRRLETLCANGFTRVPRVILRTHPRSEELCHAPAPEFPFTKRCFRMDIGGMTPEQVKEIIYRELPAVMREDSALREFVLKIAGERFADKETTEHRIDRVLDELRRDREEDSRRWDENSRRWEENSRRWEENSRRLEEDSRRWDENSRRWEENSGRWDEDSRRWDENSRRWEENSRRWEENSRWWDEWRQEWQESRRQMAEQWAENTRLWAENNRRWEEKDREWKELIARSNQRYDSSIGALGARWGIHSEASFRNGLKAILEESFQVSVTHFTDMDLEGQVFGRPDQVELDVIIFNGTLILCEIKSSCTKADLYIFWRKTTWYEEKHDRKADRKIVISPMVDDAAKKAADELGIEVYSYADQVPPGGRTLGP